MYPQNCWSLLHFRLHQFYGTVLESKFYLIAIYNIFIRIKNSNIIHVIIHLSPTNHGMCCTCTWVVDVDDFIRSQVVQPTAIATVWIKTFFLLDYIKETLIPCKSNILYNSVSTSHNTDISCGYITLMSASRNVKDPHINIMQCQSPYSPKVGSKNTADELLGLVGVHQGRRSEFMVAIALRKELVMNLCRA